MMTLSADVWQPPSGAVRDAELDAWEVAERDSGGVRHGTCTLYRDDGSVIFRCSYANGKRAGSFESYHPNGDLESDGTYLDGTLDGPFRRFTSEKPGAVPLRSCCVPPGARELRVTYRRGTSLGEAFYDADGRELCADGTPVPERAPGVPAGARFEEGEKRWVLRSLSDDGVLSRTSFDLDGRALDESDFVSSQRVAFREFGNSGTVLREHRFDAAGELHGDCLLRFDDQSVPYVDRAIREVRGTYEHGQAVGTWRFFDGAERALHVQERGEALSAARRTLLFAGDGTSAAPDGLSANAAELARAGRVREALVLAACAAARTQRDTAFRELLARTVVPLEPSVGRAHAAALDRDGQLTFESALDGLLAGADPAELVRALATLAPAARPIAGELAEAAVLLAPESRRALVTRALARLERGDGAGALADAALLEPELSEIAEEIRDVVRVVYPRFAFTPALEPVVPPDVELAKVALDQPLEAVRRTLALYATRLGIVRDEVRRRLGAEPRWLPPDVSGLLEAGPVELTRYTTTITDEDENGSETSELVVDETLSVSELSTASLMIVARADWDALVWLCWASGLDEIALPSSLSERFHFAAAVNDAIQRCFRAADQFRTAGLLSRSRGLASFVWEGMPVEGLSSRLAEIATKQYLERRAVLLWGVFPENVSPFQSDLRAV